MTMEFIDLDIHDFQALITINRPAALNALNSAVLDDLSMALDEVEQSEARAVIITGAGDKAFVAGADIKSFVGMDEQSAAQLSWRGQSVFQRLADSAIPTIAAVNGFALGGGCELALACHIRIAASNARFGQPEVKLGLIPGFGGTQRLARLVGSGMALELLTTGRMIDATEALRIGLVNRVVESAELISTCNALAGEIVQQGPQAVAWTIEAVNHGADLSMDKALELESELFGNCFATSDAEEGIQAFIDKRSANFTGA
ncbi:enoyl-CoA hydratase-related protein [Candidatus Neomarinimicrobiota bacterium]